MSASRSSSNRLLCSVAALALCAGCVDEQGYSTKTTSLKVTVSAPKDLGTDGARLADSVRQITLDVKALDEQGADDRGFMAPVDVQVHTLGSLSETMVQITLVNGAGSGTITMPTAFGKTFLWVEDVTDTPLRQATFATGTSPVLWYREPTIFDISTPDSKQSAASQLRFSPLSGKQVRVSGSKYGADGRLLVTGVFADGFSVSDVMYGQPSKTMPYGHVYVFSFGRPVDIHGKALAIGQTLKWVEGGVAEFNGFTELNFPTEEVDTGLAADASMPLPVEIDKEWLRSGPMRDLLKMEEQESGLMSVTGAKLCPLDSDYDMYKQFKVDIGLGCSAAINVITAGTISTFDPSGYVGKTIPKIVGILKTVNLGGFNVWILLPRTTADLLLP